MPAKPLTLPFDPDAERNLIASVLVDSDISKPSLKACAELGLTPGCFYEPKHQLIWNAIQAVAAEAGALPDEITVSNYLRNQGVIEQAGGIAYINELTGALFAPSPNLRASATIVSEAHQARLLIGIAQGTIQRAQSGAFKPNELAASFAAQAKAALQAYAPKEGEQRMELAELETFDRNNDPNNLIGKRWLCKGGSLLFSGQAGCGKSTLVTTMAIRWALGFDLWGMKPVKPLRILILQSENDLGDLSEQWTDCCAALNLSASERARLSEQIFIYREAVKTGEAFGQTLEELITRHSCDLAFVDPLLGFAGGDVSKQDFCSHFLRHILQPCLMRTGCALIAVHHQNKPPKKKEEQGSITSTYDFTGSSELANWFRATAILRREDNELPHFVLKLGKRGTRAGLQDTQGRFTDSLRIRHSKVRGQICWERNNDPLPSEDV